MVKYRVLCKDKWSRRREWFADISAKSPKEAIAKAKKMAKRKYTDWQAKKIGIPRRRGLFAGLRL